MSEALCGMKRSLKTLDNRNIALVTKPGEIIKQADIKMIKGEGMPTFRVAYFQSISNIKHNQNEYRNILSFTFF